MDEPLEMPCRPAVVPGRGLPWTPHTTVWSRLNQLHYYCVTATTMWLTATAHCAGHTKSVPFWVLFCSLAVLDPRVGHTMDVLSPFIPVLCHSDWLFHGESCPRLDVVQPCRPCAAFIAFVHLALFFVDELAAGNTSLGFINSPPPKKNVVRVSSGKLCSPYLTLASRTNASPIITIAVILGCAKF